MTRNTRVGGPVAASAGAVATAIGVAAAAPLAAGVWVQRAARGRVFDVASTPAGGVALVLGAQALPGGVPSAFLAARLDVAADLYRAGRVRAVIVSGDGRPEHHDEPGTMRRYLLARGLPDAAIVIDSAGRDTYDSCARAAQVFGATAVTVVSQAYHLPRALAICSRLGIEAVGAADTSMRERAPRRWRTGALREYPASLKAWADTRRRRAPQVAGPPESALSEALTDVPA